MHTKIESEKERVANERARLKKECDEKYDYAVWPLGSVNCLPPQATIYIKSMSAEKDREQFL